MRHTIHEHEAGIIYRGLPVATEMEGCGPDASKMLGPVESQMSHEGVI